MADGQVATTGLSDKPPLSVLEEAGGALEAILCELRFIRDGFKANNGVAPNHCDEFSITGGVGLLEGVLEKGDRLLGMLHTISEEAGS